MLMPLARRARRRAARALPYGAYTATYRRLISTARTSRPLPRKRRNSRRGLCPCARATQLNGLIGAVLSPFLSFVIPVTLLFKSGLKPTKLDVVCSVVYVLAVGGYAFGAGTYASIVSLPVWKSNFGRPTPST